MRLRLNEEYMSVARLEATIQQQERVVAELRRLGEPTVLAEKFLAKLKDSLATRRAREGD